jgi:multicomponent Na+:H+ antiporter subunit B
MNTPQSSIIFSRVALVVFFIANVVAIYLLLRGHNYPGGGFIAGVATAVSIILLSFVSGVETLHRFFRFDPIRIATIGLLIAVIAGCLPLFIGLPYLTTFNYKWYDVPVIGELYLGTPLLFDVGVYMVVVGVVVKTVFILMTSTFNLTEVMKEEASLYASPLEEPIEEHPVVGSDVFEKEAADEAARKNLNP